MTNTFVIKYNHLYYRQYPSTYSTDISEATQYAHPDVAKQVILDKKLTDNKVYQINFY